MTDLSKILCPKCAGVDRIFTVKLISYNLYGIKYIPQIKETCKECGRYIKFAIQTPELIKEVSIYE